MYFCHLHIITVVPLYGIIYTAMFDLPVLLQQIKKVRYVFFPYSLSIGILFHVRNCFCLGIWIYIYIYNYSNKPTQVSTVLCTPYSKIINGQFFANFHFWVYTCRLNSPSCFCLFIISFCLLCSLLGSIHTWECTLPAIGWGSAGGVPAVGWEWAAPLKANGRF